MKVSELWLREIVNPKVNTQQWIEQFIQIGLEVDSIDTIEKDTVLTLKVPPNRSDSLSMEGLAREWACINQMLFEGIKIRTILPTIIELTFPINITAKMECPRYVGRIIQNVNVNVETPAWLKNRLENAGIRSVSPVVDITNYVMLELGQPLHAFDLTKLNSEIIVRNAKEGEKIITLDEKEISLDTETLIIADKTKPLAIAGVMGGLDSAVTDKTKNIFLESAFFDPIQIRKTAQRFKLRTESSLRFEKGIDQNEQLRAIERATELLTQIVGGNVGPIIEVSNREYLREPLIIPLRTKRIEQILGLTLDDLDVTAILTRLGMKLKTTSFGWEVLIPSFRPDIGLEIDLIEEVARVYGYANIPSNSPKVEFIFNKLPENTIPLSQIKNILISRGYNETINYSFISPEMQQWLGAENFQPTLSNPISTEMSIMRESLIPGLLQNARYNQDRQVPRLRLFEVGVCFLQIGNKQNEVQEKNIISGLVQGTLFKEQWGIQKKNSDFFDIKNDIEALLQLKDKKNQNLHSQFVFNPIKNHPLLHPSQSSEIIYKNVSLGVIGAIHPALLKKIDLQGPVIVFELLADKLREMHRPNFKEISKFPSIRRDIAIIVDEHVLASQLISAIVKSVGPLLRDVWIFDVYQGKGIEPGRKSVAIGLLLQHTSKTLIDEEVNEVMKNVVSQLAKEYQAILRE